jgi:acetyltransferase-like isoleucine patch superfamily enzyme
MKPLVTGALRVGLRSVWTPMYLIWLRLRVWVWGAPALEHAVAHCPPWLGSAVLAAFGARIGHGFDYHGRLRLHGAHTLPMRLAIGDQVHIGPGVTLDVAGDITLEDRCTLSLNAQIISHMDVGYSPLAALYPTRRQTVVIESGAYIGAGAIILGGVRVGRCAVVGAGALVRQDVPAFTVVAGNPARVIRRLDPQALQPPSSGGS